jgi:hypothetical protein
MLSLVFGDSHAGRFTSQGKGAPRSRMARALGLLGCVCTGSVFAGGALGCGGDDDTETVVLADSGSLTALTSRTLDVPTTVAVRGDVAWVAESQFDHYAPFGGVGDPNPFRLIGIPLAGDPTPQSISLPANFFPEGITASVGGRLYVGSVANGSIYTVAPGATTAEQFLPAGTLPKPSVVGMAINGDGTILWVCNTVTSPPMGTLPTAAIVGIGAADRQIKATHELPPSAAGAFCNDIVIADNGTLWATESFGGRLFRIPPAELLNNTPPTAWLQASELSGPNGPQAGQFGANGLALVSGKLFIVNSSRGTLLSIDPTLAQPGSSDLHPVTLSETGVTGGVVLANPDGITKASNTELLVVENGFFVVNGMIVDRGGRRLVRVSLDTQ